MARPPPCTTMRRVFAESLRTATAIACIAAASSSNSPPSLRIVIIRIPNTEYRIPNTDYRIPNSVQPQRFIEAVGDIEVLDRLAGRTLDQVVDDRHHHQLASGTIDAPADVAVVRVRDVLDLRQVAAGEPHEGRVRIGTRQRRSDLIGAHVGFQPRINRFEDAAIE